MNLSIHPLSDIRPEPNSRDSFPIDAAAVARLEQSFATLAGVGDEMTRVFYDTLFARVPAVRAMFPPDLAQQRQKLLATLAWVVANLKNRDSMLAAVDALGRRHRGYGATAAHYPIVASCLLSAMRTVGGDQFGDEAAADWEVAINLIGERMIAAAEADSDAGGSDVTMPKDAS